MNDQVIELLEQITSDLEDTVTALRGGRVEVALAKMLLVSARLRTASQELRTAA